MMKLTNSITKTLFQKIKNISNSSKPPFSSSSLYKSIPKEKVDCLVIGAGIVGIAIAKELSVNHGREVLVVDSAPIFGTGTSSRNSEVIHAGIYYPPNTLKKSEHFRLSMNLKQLSVLEGKNCSIRIQNGVEGLRMMEGYKATTLEPELQCVKALWSPSSGIMDSHSWMLSLVGEAESHGTTFSYNTAVIGGHIEGNQIQIHVSGSNAIANWNGTSELDSELILIPKLVVNSAGLSGKAYRTVLFLLLVMLVVATSHCQTLNHPFKHLICPIPEVGGLGVHVTLDLNGQVKCDYSVHEGLKDGSLEPGYAGIRPKLSGPEEGPTDFVVQGEDIHGISGLVSLFGIESPGLTSSMAIAEHVAAKLLKNMRFLCPH
ncbi:hypothetical protein RND71_036180 [Anisodus tanguticus]|uniref:L-2-hydroxyglutarate dehydrogenase, mitochondrial n=1 Tax=Anisodus tanguticus TaxID=243964 RepID=A0AAE1R5P2_9SOLA|nr:hypothetical protein RND71_036180 [Anisodus tanguticus]